MKKFALIILAIAFTSSTLFAYVTINYYNKDSKQYKWKVTMDGNSKEIIFDAGKTAVVTVQGSGTSCVIETPCGKVTIKDRMKIEIKDGCIKIL
jgi:hypothetical protein